jgi:predicted O-methyltransferase YrrM
MSQVTWNDVDAYLVDTVVRESSALKETSKSSSEAGLPPIAVAPNQGKLLHLLVRISGSRNVLEIGTLAGYSTIWLASALGDEGRVVTLESDPRHAQIATANIARAGFSHLVEVRVGAALDMLPKLSSEMSEPFDFVFIDADKPSTAEYLLWSIDNTRPGGLIVVDNVVRNGGIVDESSEDPGILAIRRAHEILGSDPRVEATAVQTVGSKGYDGFAVAVVKDPSR